MAHFLKKHQHTDFTISAFSFTSTLISYLPPLSGETETYFRATFGPYEPCLLVFGGDSCSEDRGFESQHHTYWMDISSH